jgi:hypothetical protein
MRAGEWTNAPDGSGWYWAFDARFDAEKPHMCYYAAGGEYATIVVPGDTPTKLKASLIGGWMKIRVPKPRNQNGPAR